MKRVLVTMAEYEKQPSYDNNTLYVIVKTKTNSLTMLKLYAISRLSERN